VAVGSPLIVFDVADSAQPAAAPLAAANATAVSAAAAPAVAASAAALVATRAAVVPEGVAATRVMASPANRRRAREAGLSLANLQGSGPRGRILQSDIAAASAQASKSVPIGPAPAGRAGSSASASDTTTEIKVIGLRRVIAQRMAEAKRNIPHFAYVDEVDVTELEALRQHLNETRHSEQPTLTYLPLVILALTRTLALHPQCNVRYDEARGVLVRHSAVHVGVATQTPDGLKVPVVRHAESLSLWELATAIRASSERARSNRSSREELSGSTITVTSLGKLGGIASTPVINAPEVAIVGLNKAVERPVVVHGAIAVRRVMNLSSSFDHRFVDGYDAAAMIQTLKAYLEHPATIFIPAAPKGVA
jgi:2-oxoisovalerate dehydrogenase E2 component (dihydrolipoyl transacylase)